MTPRGRWGLTWLAVVIAVAATVIRFELFLRSRGYQPSIKDDEYAWTWQRMRIDDSPRTVAVLGSSRIMLGFSPTAFRETLPGWRFVMLAINGTTPIGSLQDLARDPKFRGVAIVEMNETGFYRVNWSAQDAYVAAYHRRSRAIGSMIERLLATEVQSRLAILSTRGVVALGKLVQNRAWPKPPYVTMHADRTRVADFSMADLESERRLRVERLGPEYRHHSPARFLDDALALEPFVAMIQGRGGRVVYVRMPTCDERWKSDEFHMPKAEFWDQLAGRTIALTIHFKDFSELSSFPCPDTVHLDSRDAPDFTRRLLAILRARGVLDR